MEDVLGGGASITEEGVNSTVSTVGDTTALTTAGPVAGGTLGEVEVTMFTSGAAITLSTHVVI